MVDRGLLMISLLVVDDSQVDMSQELACHISNFLVTCVELNGIVIELGVLLSKLHVVNSNAVVRKSLSMDIANGFANLQEPLVLVNSHLELSQVVVKNSS